MNNIIRFFIYNALFILIGCTDYIEESQRAARIILSAEIKQEAVSRVNDNGFTDGDMMGVYVVDYNGSVPGELQTRGNRADNVRFTYNGSNNSWTGSQDIYWLDNHTCIDVYGYYPYDKTLSDTTPDYPFTVQRDQSKASTMENMGGFEKSDFLWGKVSEVSPTSNAIRLPLYHRLSVARVKLAKGEGFNDEEWNELEKQVIVSNLARECVINMKDGNVKSVGQVESQATIPSKVEDEWRAIVVPQTIAAQMTMFVITVDGKPYKFLKNEAFTYESGKMCNFTIRIDRKLDDGTFKLTLVGESITDWDNDLVSHNAVAKEYFVVHSTPGGLRNAILDAGKDFRKIKNLKITGKIDLRDFYFMRDSMDMLSALNLKQVRIKGYGRSSVYNIPCMDDQIPGEAFFRNDTGDGKLSLCSLMLPDTLVSIGNRAFRACRNLTGSLVIPEGVVDIQQGAFSECNNLNGTLTLPSTLKKLGNCGNDKNQDTRDEEIDYYGGVFQHCGFVGGLIIPDGVELIRGYCFECCEGFETLRLPNSLKRMGTRAFAFCRGLKGSLDIPLGITNIPQDAFRECQFDGTLHLHDGITTIESNAFSTNHFRGELILPKYLKTINNEAFRANNFSGTLHLPKTLISIGNYAFSENKRISGIVDIPEGVVSIGEHAFEGCPMIEGLVIPESVETIRKSAFSLCYGIGTVVCKGILPPSVGDNAFDGVAKMCVLEVPESAVAQYTTAVKWREFKRITAHHELVCHPSVACALSTEHKQTVVVYAEGEWEVSSKPEWCDVTPSSGKNKTEVTITIKAMNSSTGNRNGEVVFQLKEKNYTSTCRVSQCGYQYAEDEYLALQKATQGQRGGINIVVLGDGYNAEDISNGTYLNDMKSQVERFFDIEPYTTYRKYFNVYTAFPLSTEQGIGTVNTIRYNKFNTNFTGVNGLKADYDDIFNYALNAPTVTRDNLAQTLIIIVPNSSEYGGITQMWEDGRAIAFCPLSTDDYPFDSRGVIQHEAGGHGFGKLADEYIYHNAFIDACHCSCCGHDDAVSYYQSLGWYDNISLSNKSQKVGWYHLVYDSRYSDIVDIYEGAYMHSRGVFRSEQNSCMNNDIPYYSTISRESIVRRIMKYAGEPYTFESFVARDSRRATVGYTSNSRSRTTVSGSLHRSSARQHHSPVIHKK